MGLGFRRHAWVWNPFVRDMIHLNDLPTTFSASDVAHLGEYLPPAVAQAISHGKRRPDGAVSAQQLLSPMHIPQRLPPKRHNTEHRPTSPRWQR